MPTPYADGFILLQPRVEKQLAYNAGKLSQKMLIQKQQAVQALLEMGLGDGAVLCKYLNLHQSPDEFERAIGVVAYEMIKSNAPAFGDGDNLPELFAAGFSSAAELEKIKANLTFAADLIEDDYWSVPNEIEKLKSKFSRPTSFNLTLKLRGPKGSYYANGTIGNKPPGPQSSIVKPSKSFDWNKFRGGEQNSITLDFNDKSNLESLKSRNFNLTDIFQLIKKHKKRISCFVIIGGIIYLVFKKRKFLRRFLSSIKRLLKPIKSLYSYYTRIKRCKILDNRFSKGIFVFVRVINKA